MQQNSEKKARKSEIVNVQIYEMSSSSSRNGRKKSPSKKKTIGGGGALGFSYGMSPGGRPERGPPGPSSHSMASSNNRDGEDEDDDGDGEDEDDDGDGEDEDDDGEDDDNDFESVPKKKSKKSGKNQTTKRKREAVIDNSLAANSLWNVPEPLYAARDGFIKEVNR